MQTAGRYIIYIFLENNLHVVCTNIYILSLFPSLLIISAIRDISQSIWLWNSPKNKWSELLCTFILALYCFMPISPHLFFFFFLCFLGKTRNLWAMLSSTTKRKVNCCFFINLHQTVGQLCWWFWSANSPAEAMYWVCMCVSQHPFSSIRNYPPCCTSCGWEMPKIATGSIVS